MALETGRKVLEIEARAITALMERLDGRFEQAVEMLRNCTGLGAVAP